jgi:hypothetical protein
MNFQRGSDLPSTSKVYDQGKWHTCVVYLDYRGPGRLYDLRWTSKFMHDLEKALGITEKPIWYPRYAGEWLISGRILRPLMISVKNDLGGKWRGGAEAISSGSDQIIFSLAYLPRFLSLDPTFLVCSIPTLFSGPQSINSMTTAYVRLFISIVWHVHFLTTLVKVLHKWRSCSLKKTGLTVMTVLFLRSYSKRSNKKKRSWNTSLLVVGLSGNFFSGWLYHFLRRTDNTSILYFVCLHRLDHI